VLTSGLLQLGFAAAIALALAARLGALLQYLFPVAAVLTAVLIERRSLTGYLSFVIWLWMLTPFVRRVADLQSGWHEPSLILLAPYGASAYPAACLPSCTARARKGRRRKACPWRWIPRRCCASCTPTLAPTR